MSNETIEVPKQTKKRAAAAVKPFNEERTQVDVDASQTQKIQTLVSKLSGGSLDAIHSFGREVGAHAGAHTDAILSKLQSDDIGGMGEKLITIVTTAKTLNISAVAGTRSNIPFFGKFVDQFRLNRDEVSRKFQDVGSQVDSLMVELNQMQSELALRISALEDSFESVKNEHSLLETHIEAGEQGLKVLQARVVRDQATATDPFKQQELHDLRGAVAALEKRIADMRVLQHSAMQQLPMIRMVQANNRMLIEKFHTVRDLTIPAWKRQFMLALSLNEQKNAVQLANSIDDATNAFLIENAKLLKDNTISTAKANQRLVINIETLQQVHDSLIETVSEVARINAEGLQQRAAISQSLKVMKANLASNLVQQHEPKRIRSA
jgi:uncharacterized protein YaaN involved in tellurite resistance